jgi:hypothetical protein
MESVDAIIAGVNKAGTTSLYVSLAAHPDVVPSAIKETGFFLPARYGGELPAIAVWDEYFSAKDRPVRLEATPSYFYGGGAVARAIRTTLPNPKVVLVLREPVGRAISFFEYQKVRLRIPLETTFGEYLAHADALGADDWDDPANERYMAVRGGRYADWLPGWWEELGTDSVKIVYFEDLVAYGSNVLDEVTAWLGIDPAAAPPGALAAENTTTSFKSRRLQAIALRVNDRFERGLRRVPKLKRAARWLYRVVNGRALDRAMVSDLEFTDLLARFVEPNRRLGKVLDRAGVPRPPWLPFDSDQLSGTVSTSVARSTTGGKPRMSRRADRTTKK